MDAFKCIMGDYYGAYEEMEPAYKDLETYMKMNDLEKTGDILEFYITDPVDELDTTKWLTHIVYPIS